MIGYLLFTCTKFVPDLKTQYQTGWASICIVGILFTVNFGLMLSQGLAKAFKRYKKWKHAARCKVIEKSNEEYHTRI